MSKHLSSVLYQIHHIPDSAVQADEDRPGYDSVPDVEFLDPAQRGDFFDIAVIEAMARIDPESDL